MDDSSIGEAFFIIIFYKKRRQAIWSKGACETFDFLPPYFEMQDKMHHSRPDFLWTKIHFLSFKHGNTQEKNLGISTIMEIPMQHGNLLDHPLLQWGYNCRLPPFDLVPGLGA